MSPTPQWTEMDNDDADRHRTRETIARLETRDCCDDLRAEVERLRDLMSHPAEDPTCIESPCQYHEVEARMFAAEAKVARVEALADKWEWGALRWADPLPVPPYVEQVRAALADPAPVVPERHDDTQDGAR